MKSEDRALIEDWERLCKAAQLPTKPFPNAQLLHDRYVKLTGAPRPGGEAAVELLRERVIEVNARLRRRALSKHMQEWRSPNGE